MLSRDEMRQVERSLANSEQDTRDEIGFLLVHQGLADRFFPGTSVLHERLRYVLFVPWIYRLAAVKPRRGSDVRTTINHLQIDLARRLKVLGGEPRNVIGGEKLGYLTSQPPDQVYWNAMRMWGIARPEVSTRSEAIRRLVTNQRKPTSDDDGGPLIDEETEVFCSLPDPPSGWDDSKIPLRFGMTREEREFFQTKLRRLLRSDGNASLLAKLIGAKEAFPKEAIGLPVELDHYADAADRTALQFARDAAALSAIGRAVYGALVEAFIAADGKDVEPVFQKELETHFDTFAEAASSCDLTAVKLLLPNLPEYLFDVLVGTQNFVRAGKAQQFHSLHKVYERSEYLRKGGRARLLSTERAKLRREDWDPDRHNTDPLHYRWRIVHLMLEDLRGGAQ